MSGSGEAPRAGRLFADRIRSDESLWCWSHDLDAPAQLGDVGWIQSL
jgi:hypothetical protein